MLEAERYITAVPWRTFQFYYFITPASLFQSCFLTLLNSSYTYLRNQARSSENMQICIYVCTKMAPRYVLPQNFWDLI